VSRVALTFDTEFQSRPTGAGTEDAILAALDAAGAKATFFLQGAWAAVHPETARRIAAAGHLVGNHSQFHAPFTGLTDNFLRQDVCEAEEAIVAATGVDPRPWFRCPYGRGGDDPRVLAALEEVGYRHVGWDVDPRDWEAGRTPQELDERVRAGVREHGDGAIVLLHGWPEATAEALPGLLEALLASGAELVAVDEVERR